MTDDDEATAPPEENAAKPDQPITGAVRPSISWRQLRQEAITAIEKGYSIFPLRIVYDGDERTMYPLTLWRQHGSWPEPELVEAWPAAKWKRATHIGLACGESEIVVPDLDVKEGKDGFAEWARLLAEHTETPTAPTAPTAPTMPTRSGGLHHFYGANPELPCGSRNNGLARGVDVKAMGGMVVLYGWASELPEVATLPLVPTWIPQAVGEPSEASGGHTGTGRALRRATVPIAELLALPSEHPDRGHDWLLAIAGHFATKHRKYEPYVAAVREQDKKSDDPHDERDFLGVVDWVWAREQAKHVESNSAEAPTAPERKRKETGWYTSQQVIDMPPPEWLIEGVLVQNSFAVLYGQPGGGKSFVALDWACSVGTGELWAGHPTAHLPVLYILGEGFGGIGRRLVAWQVSRGGIAADGVLWQPQTVNLLEEGGPDWDFLGQLEDLRPGLIVIDTFARALVGGEENSAKDVGLAVAACDTIRRVSGATVLLVHHSRKDGTEMRGSSALLGGVDTAIECDKKGRQLTLTCKKQKDSEPFDQTVMRMVDFEDSIALRQAGAAEIALVNMRHTPEALAILREHLGGTGPFSRVQARDVLRERMQIGRSEAYRLLTGLVEQCDLRTVGPPTKPQLEFVTRGN